MSEAVFPEEHSHVTKNIRVCLRCSRAYPRAVFTRPGKLYSDWCQACEGELKEQRARSGRARRREMKLTASAPMKFRRKACALWGAARTRAWRHSVPFELSHVWVLNKLLAGVCDVTGLRFHLEGAGARHNFCPSIERREAAKGYTEENCQLVVWIYNAAKGCGTHQDVVRMAEALMRREKA